MLIWLQCFSQGDLRKCHSPIVMKRIQWTLETKQRDPYFFISATEGFKGGQPPLELQNCTYCVAVKITKIHLRCE